MNVAGKLRSAGQALDFKFLFTFSWLAKEEILRLQELEQAFERWCFEFAANIEERQIRSEYDVKQVFGDVYPKMSWWEYFVPGLGGESCEWKRLDYSYLFLQL